MSAKHTSEFAVDAGPLLLLMRMADQRQQHAVSSMVACMLCCSMSV
jgi:hypothetical protein